MRINTVGIHFQITDSMRDAIQKEVGKLERYFDADTDANLVLSIERHCHKAEITISCDGTTIRSEVGSDDMYLSIAAAVEKLEKQLHSHRSRLEHRLRAGAFYDDEDEGDLDDEELDVLPSIVRTKRIPLKPIDLEEAILQMELLGHSFFVFTNALTGAVNVLYHRKDGNYGLIEPEY